MTSEFHSIRAQRALDRSLALTVPCAEPRCHALEGNPCRNLVTGDPLDETSHQSAHRRRLQDAGVQ